MNLTCPFCRCQLVHFNGVQRMPEDEPDRRVYTCLRCGNTWLPEVPATAEERAEFEGFEKEVSGG